MTRPHSLAFTNLAGGLPGGITVVTEQHEHGYETYTLGDYHKQYRWRNEAEAIQGHDAIAERVEFYLTCRFMEPTIEAA